MATIAGFSNTAHAVESGRPDTDRVTLKVSGDEYESSDGAVLNRSDGAQCPPSRDIPVVHARCWTWTATRLGHGTFVHAKHLNHRTASLGTSH
jgi:hypothetical protein